MEPDPPTLSRSLRQVQCVLPIIHKSSSSQVALTINLTIGMTPISFNDHDLRPVSRNPDLSWEHVATECHCCFLDLLLTNDGRNGTDLVSDWIPPSTCFDEILVNFVPPMAWASSIVADLRGCVSPSITSLGSKRVHLQSPWSQIPLHLVRSQNCASLYHLLRVRS